MTSRRLRAAPSGLALLVVTGCATHAGPLIPEGAVPTPLTSITHGAVNTPMVPPDDTGVPGATEQIDPYAPTPTDLPSALATLRPGDGTNPPGPPTPSCASERASTSAPLAQMWQDVLTLGAAGPSPWLQNFVDAEDNYAAGLQEGRCTTAESRAVHEATGRLVDDVNARGDTADAVRDVDQAITALMAAEGDTHQT